MTKAEKLAKEYARETWSFDRQSAIAGFLAGFQKRGELDAEIVEGNPKVEGDSYRDVCARRIRALDSESA